jgi:hypothetical protein
MGRGGLGTTQGNRAHPLHSFSILNIDKAEILAIGYYPYFILCMHLNKIHFD